MRRAIDPRIEKVLSKISIKAIELEDEIEELAKLYAAEGHVHGVHRVMIEFHKPTRITHRLAQICGNLDI